ncbi:hypothetical protein TanjilG_01463 [Lupinus angustifolius]|uniref:Uncharacterized protein n=1 Tax=Lupinus angustifolius TaxID=3871 RepID=A0A4P1QVT7_LUPAN|nr:hypothetical protein TanjilG_01463 [Lupinus angustifolius]
MGPHAPQPLLNGPTNPTPLDLSVSSQLLALPSTTGNTLNADSLSFGPTRDSHVTLKAPQFSNNFMPSLHHPTLNTSADPRVLGNVPINAPMAPLVHPSIQFIKKAPSLPQPLDLEPIPSNSSHVEAMHSPQIPSIFIDLEDKVIFGELCNDRDPIAETHTKMPNRVKKKPNWMKNYI